MKMETEPTEQQRFCKTEARVHIATTQDSQAIDRRVGVTCMQDAPSWTLMSSAPKEERLRLLVAEANGAFLSRRRSLFACARANTCALEALHTPLRCNVREYLLPAAVWRALRPGSAPLRAIDRHRPQQRPCLDIEAATSG